MRFAPLVLNMSLISARARGQVQTEFVTAHPQAGAAILYVAPDSLAARVGDLGVHEFAALIRQEGEWSLVELRGIQGWASTRTLLTVPNAGVKVTVLAVMLALVFGLSVTVCR
jgi:hypothetical protein